MSNKEIKLLKTIEILQKKNNELHKYKNFVELEKNSKNFFEKFQKITENNLKLVNHIKEQRNIIDLLQKEKNEYKNKLNKMNDNGLGYVNKKKFYELNLKINELEKYNEELKNIIKIKENKFIEIKINMKNKENENIYYKNMIENFIKSYKKYNDTEDVEEDVEEDSEINSINSNIFN